MKQKLKIASNWVSDEQESEAHKSDDKTNEEDVQFVCELTPALNWYCPTTPAWRKQKCKQFLTANSQF